jgi:hypothetical protein
MIGRTNFGRYILDKMSLLFPVIGPVVEKVAIARFARTLDTLAIGVLATLGVWMSLSWPYFVGCGGAVAFLLYKYSLVNPSDLSRMGLAFDRINAYISYSMLAGTLAAIYL